MRGGEAIPLQPGESGDKSRARLPRRRELRLFLQFGKPVAEALDAELEGQALTVTAEDRRRRLLRLAEALKKIGGEIAGRLATTLAAILERNRNGLRRPGIQQDAAIDQHSR